MSNIIVPGFTAEGNTDVRFLESVIQRTFEYVAFECHTEIEVYDITYISSGKSSFVDEMLRVAETAYDRGIMVLCVHTDADDDSDKQAFEKRIEPAFRAIHSFQDKPVCKNLIAVVPVQMTEAWLLADVDLLREELGTTKSESELGLNRHPETIAKPKALIEDAIRIVFDELPKRRRRPTLSDLYLPLGQKNQFGEIGTIALFH